MSDILPNVSPPTAEQALQDLAYAVSHDLGASARAIRAFSELLATRCCDQLDEQAQGFLHRITQGSADLQAQIGGLLAYSRVISHGQPPQPAAVESIWRNVVDCAAMKAQAAEAQIESSELPVVLADPVQLEQLLAELLDNSLKFRRETLLIVRLTAERWDGAWLFRFHDNGRGIEPKHHDRVFRMFQRLNLNIPGVGAGLTVAQRIVQRHGGQIWIESEPNDGTTVCFTWSASA